MRTTTISYRTCLYKCILFATTIILELILGYTSSDKLYTDFYLTVLVQAVNNFYDASNYLEPTKFTKFCLVRTSLTMVTSVIACGMAICYISSDNDSIIKTMLSSKCSIRLVAALLMFIIVCLVVELVIHFNELPNIQTNKNNSYTQMKDCSVQSGVLAYFEEFKENDDMKCYSSLYGHGRSDELRKIRNKSNS